MVEKKITSFRTFRQRHWRKLFIVSGCICLCAIALSVLVYSMDDYIRKNLQVRKPRVKTPTSVSLHPHHVHHSLWQHRTAVTPLHPVDQTWVLREKSKVIDRVVNELLKHSDFDRQTQEDLFTIVSEDENPRKHDKTESDNFVYGKGTGRSLEELKWFIYMQIDHFTHTSLSYADISSPEEGDSVIIYRSDLSLMQIVPRVDGKMDVIIDVRMRHFSGAYAQSTDIEEEQFDVFLRVKDANQIRLFGISPDDIRYVIDWYLENMSTVEKQIYKDRYDVISRFHGLPDAEAQQMIQTILLEYIQRQFEENPYQTTGASE